MTGILVTGIHVGIVIFFMTFIAPEPVIANGLAFVLATCVSYVLNTVWSFSSRVGRRSLGRFCAVALLGMALAMIVSGAAEYAGLQYLWGVALVILCVTPTTFALHNAWTYRSDPNAG